MVEEDKDGKAERSKDKARAPPFACIVNSGCGRRPIDHGLLRGGSWLAATFLGGIFLFIVHCRMVVADCEGQILSLQGVCSGGGLHALECCIRFKYWCEIALR